MPIGVQASSHSKTNGHPSQHYATQPRHIFVVHQPRLVYSYRHFKRVLSDASEEAYCSKARETHTYHHTTLSDMQLGEILYVITLLYEHVVIN